jgi:aldose 1-epimerase
VTEILEAGDARLVISPALGGRYTSLVVAGQELLVTEGAGPTLWGCFPMAPFAGRIRDGRFTFRDRAVSIPPNLPPHAIHGTAFQRRWQVTGPGTLSVDLGPDWPFRGRVSQTVRLSPDGLDATLTVEADEPMPASLGWHPWFRRHLVGTVSRPTPPSPGVEIDVDAATMYERGTDHLPTGVKTVPKPRPWDDCFTDLQAAPAVRWPGVLELEVTATSDYWVVYDEPVEGVCVEPQTAPPDFVNLAAAAGHEPPSAEPGRPLTIAMSWRWRVETG